jgi:FlaG/FlaF family flagellin (archaellin)
MAAVSRPSDRGVSTVLAVVMLVAVAIIAAAVVGGYSFGIVEDVLGTDTPRAAYEFDYEAERGLVRVTQTGGETFSSSELDSLYVTVTDGGTTERFAWGSSLPPEGSLSSGSSVAVDDANGAATGAFTFSGRYGPGTVVRVVFEGRSEGYVLAAYEVPRPSRTYLRWQVPTTGLEAHYPLDETDPVAVDAVGGADGDVRGDPTLGAAGQVGTAYGFGGDDYVALSRSYDGTGSVGRLTACAWFNTAETGAGEFDNWALVDFDRSEYFNLYVRGDTGAVGFSTSGPAATMVDHSTPSGYADGAWHLACGTYDASTDRKRIYVDGDLKVDVAASNPGGLGTGEERWGFIGDGSEADAFDGDRNDLYFTGRVDEARLYDAALTESEVESLFDAGRGSGTAPTRGLVNHWRLDETGPAGTTGVRDVVGGGDGVVVGSTTGRGVDGRVGTAYEFGDGSGYVALDRAYASDDVGNVTACAWFRTGETDGSQNWALLDFDRSEYFNLYVEGDGDVGWSTSAVPGYTGSDVDDLFARGGYNDGDWHHACGVYDGDKRVVVDGTERASRADPHGGDTLGTGATRYGVVGDGSEASDYAALVDPSNGDQRNGYYYQGAVDDVRLYERGLSAAETARLWAFTGGATAGYGTEPMAFPTPVGLDSLRLERVRATIPSGTAVEVEVRADTDGDGACDAASDRITLDGSGSYEVTGLSGTAERACLWVRFTASGGETPTLEGADLVAG